MLYKRPPLTCTEMGCGKCISLLQNSVYLTPLYFKDGKMMLDSQTNNLQLTLEYKKLRFKYNNNAIKDVDHCIFQGFTYKKYESNFQKNGLLH